MRTLVTHDLVTVPVVHRDRPRALFAAGCLLGASPKWRWCLAAAGAITFSNYSSVIRPVAVKCSKQSCLVKVLPCESPLHGQSGCVRWFGPDDGDVRNIRKRHRRS